MNRKMIVKRGLFICLACAFFYYTIFSSKGFITQWTLNRRMARTEQAITRINKDIVYLEHALLRTKTDPFEMEKHARFDVAMSYTNELIYRVY